MYVCTENEVLSFSGSKVIAGTGTQTDTYRQTWLEILPSCIFAMSMSMSMSIMYNSLKVKAFCSFLWGYIMLGKIKVETIWYGHRLTET